MALDPAGRVRASVAANLSSPERALARLAADSTTQSRVNAVRNPNTPPDAIMSQVSVETTKSVMTAITSGARQAAHLKADLSVVSATVVIAVAVAHDGGSQRGWAADTTRGRQSGVIDGDADVAALAGLAAVAASSLGFDLRNRTVRVPDGCDYTVPQGRHFEALTASIDRALTKRHIDVEVGSPPPSLQRVADSVLRSAPKPEMWVAVDAGFKDGRAELGWVTLDGRSSSIVTTADSARDAEYLAVAQAVNDLGNGVALRVLCDEISVVRGFQSTQRRRNIPGTTPEAFATFAGAVMGRTDDSCWWVPGGSGLHGAAHNLTQTWRG